MTVVVSRDAVRQFVREALSSPGTTWDSSSSIENSPVTISAVVDPSAALTDPGNEKFRPQNRAELKAALSPIVDDISDDDSAEIFDAIQSAVKLKDEKEEKMKTKKASVEEAIRQSVRKMLSEMGPYRDTGMSYSGPGIGSTAKKGMEECEPCEGEGYLPDGSECKVCKGTGEVPAKAKRGYQMADVEAGMATLEDIAKEMGYAGPPGARQAIEKATKKAQFLAGMEPDDYEIMVLTAMNDYVKELQSSGELTPEDVKLLKSHPNIVSELDGFREFLQKYIKKAMKE